MAYPSKSQMLLLARDASSKVSTELEKKVDKIAGKGLSTNDYTSADKEKLDSLINYDDSDIRNRIDQKQDKLSFDEYPVEGSKNPVTSDGVYKYIQLEIDNVLSTSY